MHLENDFHYTDTREFLKKQIVIISPVYLFLKKLFECFHFSTFFLKLTLNTKTVVWHVVEWCKFESEFTTLC